MEGIVKIGGTASPAAEETNSMELTETTIGETAAESAVEATAETTFETTTETTAETTVETISEETEETINEAAVLWEPQTFVEGFLSGGWIYAAIGLAVALVIGSVAKARRRKRRKARRRNEHIHRTVSAPPAERTTVSMDVPPAIPAAGINSAAFQDVGAREDQQDSYGVSDVAYYPQQGVMAVVADGMGGLSNGKAVSSALVRVFLEGFSSMAGCGKPQEILLDMAIRANYQINQMLQGADRSGSTLVSAMIRNGYLHFLTVGDSRIYLYRGGALLQLNREHIYQEELAVKAVNRLIPISQVTGDRQAHSLTSYFGIGRIPGIDRNDEGIKLVPGDRILLCSDGVFGTLSQDQMEQAMRCDINETAKIMGDMIREADRPYQDNNTGVILEYLG